MSSQSFVAFKIILIGMSSLFLLIFVESHWSLVYGRKCSRVYTSLGFIKTVHLLSSNFKADMSYITGGGLKSMVMNMPTTFSIFSVSLYLTGS